MSSSFVRQAQSLLGQRLISESVADAYSTAGSEGAVGYQAISLHSRIVGLASNSAPHRLVTEGEQLIYRRAGSAPGWPLLVSLNDGSPVLMFPGERLVAPFSSVSFIQPDWFQHSAPTQTHTILHAEFLATRGKSDFYESRLAYTVPRRAWLLGNATTYGAVPQNTNPVSTGTEGIVSVPGFYPAGYRRVRLRWRYSGNENVSSGRLIPWIVYVPAPYTNVSTRFDRMESHALDLPAPTEAPSGDDWRNAAIDWDIPTPASDRDPLVLAAYGDAALPAFTPYVAFELRGATGTGGLLLNVEGLE
jgi:hypothetical protein